MSVRLMLLLTLALVSVSTSSIFVRMLPGIPAVVIAFWRMATAGLILFGVDLVKPYGFPKKGVWLKLTAAGVFLGFHFACFFGAVKLTSIANATLLGTTAPFFTVLIEKLILKRSISFKVRWGLLLAACGALVIHGGDFTTLMSTESFGNFLALIGSFWLALVWLFAESVRKSTGTIVFSRSVYIIAALTLIIVAFAMGHSTLSFQSKDIPWFLALGIVPTIMGHTTFSYAIKYVSPTIIASVPLGEPIIASILAWIFLSESVPMITVIGGILTLSGLYLITSKSIVSSFQGDNF